MSPPGRLRTPSPGRRQRPCQRRAARSPHCRGRTPSPRSYPLSSLLQPRSLGARTGSLSSASRRCRPCNCCTRCRRISQTGRARKRCTSPRPARLRAAQTRLGSCRLCQPRANKKAAQGAVRFGRTGRCKASSSSSRPQRRCCPQRTPRMSPGRVQRTPARSQPCTGTPCWLRWNTLPRQFARRRKRCRPRIRRRRRARRFRQSHRRRRSSSLAWTRSGRAARTQPRTGTPRRRPRESTAPAASACLRPRRKACRPQQLVSPRAL